MNLTINSHSSTWKNPRNPIIAIGAVALAISVAIGGISSLPGSGSREASVTPQTISRPSTLFGTDADAVFAAQGPVEITPMFGTSADAVFAVESLQPVTSGAGDAGEYLGLGQPAVGQSFATMADAVAALEALRPVTSEAVDTGEYLGLGQPATGQSFGTTADAVFALTQPVAAGDALDANLGLGQPGERSAAANPLFTSLADAEAASVALGFSQTVATDDPSNYLGIGQPGEGVTAVAPMFPSMVDAALAN
jgi:hypothetical protein